MWGVVEENKTTGAYRELAEEKVDIIGGCHMMAYKRLQVRGYSCSPIEGLSFDFFHFLC